MERYRRIFSGILTFAAYVFILNGCLMADDDGGRVEVNICFGKGGEFMTKADMPDEDKISDISILIFDSNGMLERMAYLPAGQHIYEASLLKGMRYTIFACANFGYQIKAKTIEELKQLEFHLAYPDEYREGIPMSAIVKDVLVEGNTVIDVGLERLMACISIKMDRSRLSDKVSMNVTGIRIGNCPKKARPFVQSQITSGDECFKVGFSHDDIGCTPLNRFGLDGISDEISLYMLENMQGRFSAEALSDDQDKVFKEHDPRKDICSYIELELEYSNGDLASIEKPLIYRFYLGEDRNSLDVERNCHYHITVTPEDDGLKGDGWRVDKSGIRYVGMPSLEQYPDDYIVGNIGDVIHIGCHLTPSYAPFDIGLAYLEADRAEGIYEYEIDKDGHGVTLTLTGPGRGLIYMEAGDPINDAALFLIEVNLPE